MEYFSKRLSMVKASDSHNNDNIPKKKMIT